MAKEPLFNWISTHESVDLGEVSVLATVETLIAMSISLGIAWYLETILHIVVGACVAPLLLLRTEESTELGLSMAGKLLDRIDGVESDSYRAIVFAFIFPLCIIFIRVAATTLIFFSKPLRSISSIPDNWKKIVLCLDFASSPELVPGFSLSKMMKKRNSLPIQLKHVREMFFLG